MDIRGVHIGFQIGRKDFSYFLFTSHPEKFKTDFHDDYRGGHLGFMIGMFLAVLTYKSLWYFLLIFESTDISVQEKKDQNRFSRWRPSWISNRTILATFDLQVTLIVHTKFPELAFRFHDKVTIHLQANGHGDHLGFPIVTIVVFFFFFLYFFLSTSSPDTYYQVSTGLSVEEKSKIDFFSKWFISVIVNKLFLEESCSQN